MYSHERLDAGNEISLYMVKRAFRRIAWRLNTLDLLFVFAFFCSLGAFMLTEHLLPRGCSEVGLITSAYYRSVGLGWIFVIQWSFLSSIYYVLRRRGGRVLRSRGDVMTVLLFMFLLAFFCFVDMLNDLLVWMWLST